MSNNEAVVFYCPSCGASIAMHGDQGICAFCGTAIERPKSARSPQPVRPPQDQPPVWNGRSVTITRANLAKPKRGSSCLGTLIMLMILAAVGLAVGAALTGGRLLTAISSGPGPVGASGGETGVGILLLFTVDSAAGLPSVPGGSHFFNVFLKFTFLLYSFKS